jgi:hypothetical protein
MGGSYEEVVTREPLSREQEILFLRRRLTFMHRLERRLKEQTETLTSLRERAERLPELSGPISPHSNGLTRTPSSLAGTAVPTIGTQNSNDLNMLVR